MIEIVQEEPAFILMKSMIMILLLWILHDQLDLARRGFKIARGPWRLPIIGNTHQILSHYYTRLEYFAHLAETYGPVHRFDLLGTRGTFVSSPDLVEYILKTKFDNFEKGQLFQSRMTTLLGHGIFNADGASWKTQRKVASHMFNQRTMRDHMTGVFVSHGKSFVQKCGTLSDGSFDIQDLYFRYTLDAIGEIAFGQKLGALEAQESPAFARAFDQANATCEFRFLNPVWRLSQLFLPSEIQCRENMAFLKNFSANIISTRRLELELNTKGRFWIV